MSTRSGTRPETLRNGLRFLKIGTLAEMSVLSLCPRATPDNAEVRADVNVLAIMATMPNVKVRHTITAGQPTLTLSDTWPLLDSSGYVESLVINASTGFPIAQSGNTPGYPLHVTYYHTHRVTLANVEAGKFKL